MFVDGCECESSCSDTLLDAPSVHVFLTPLIPFLLLLQELLERESRVSEVQKKLSEATHRLNEVQDRCDDVSDTLNSRTGSGEGYGDSADGSGGAGGGIVRLKDGLKTIKSEIKEMSMAIMMLNHNLLSERLQQSRGRQTTYQRRARRHNTPKDSILSDDEILDWNCAANRSFYFC